MDKVTTIIRKEWSEVFKNKIVFFSVLFLPLILAILPLGMLFFFNQAEGMEAELTDPEILSLAGDMCIGLELADCTLVYMLNIFVLMFMILPVAIPVTIAASFLSSVCLEMAFSALSSGSAALTSVDS